MHLHFSCLKIYKIVKLVFFFSSKGLVICDFLKRDMCCANYIFAKRRFSWLKLSFHS
jgi:hypothetical protein